MTIVPDESYEPAVTVKFEKNLQSVAVLPYIIIAGLT